MNDTFQILEALLDTFQKTKYVQGYNPFSPYKDSLIICYDSLYFTSIRHFKRGKYVFLSEDQICELVSGMEKEGN